MNRDSNTFVVVLILALSVALAGVGIALLMSTSGPTAAASPQGHGWFGQGNAAAERERRRAEDMAAKAAADAAKIENERRRVEQATKEKEKQVEPKAKPGQLTEENKEEMTKEEMKKESTKPEPSLARTEEEEKAAERFRDSTISREAVAREKRRKDLLANRGIPFGRFNPVMCAEKSAADFERSFFEDEPSAKTSIAFVDVSTSDGSLIVHFTQELEKGPEAARKAAADVVVRAWRESKFTTKLGFSKIVEFRGSDRVLFMDEG